MDEDDFDPMAQHGGRSNMSRDEVERLNRQLDNEPDEEHEVFEDPEGNLFDPQATEEWEQEHERMVQEAQDLEDLNHEDDYEKALAQRQKQETEDEPEAQEEQDEDADEDEQNEPEDIDVRLELAKAQAKVEVLESLQKFAPQESRERQESQNTSPHWEEGVRNVIRSERQRFQQSGKSDADWVEEMLVQAIKVFKTDDSAAKVQALEEKFAALEQQKTVSTYTEQVRQQIKKAGFDEKHLSIVEEMAIEQGRLQRVGPERAVGLAVKRLSKLGLKPGKSAAPKAQRPQRKPPSRAEKLAATRGTAAGQRAGTKPSGKKQIREAEDLLY